jgi:hypothetical protein
LDLVPRANLLQFKVAKIGRGVRTVELWIRLWTHFYNGTGLINCAPLAEQLSNFSIAGSEDGEKGGSTDASATLLPWTAVSSCGLHALAD